MGDKDLKFDPLTVDLGDSYGGAGNYSSITYTTDTSDPYTITLDDSYGYSSDFGSYEWTLSETGSKGIDITEGDLTIEGRSMKEFMDNVEKRLAILNVNQELEEQWEELKKLGDKYRELEEQLLERNKIMEILKED
jgi:hypothetical protein